MQIGFTGTQAGMTNLQKVVFGAYLRLRNGTFHHGDCIGADAHAHNLARSHHFRIVVHPPIIAAKRAWMAGDEIREPKNYLIRNKDIVFESELLIATPKEVEEQLRSGTWSTVRFARKRRKRILLIFPNGDTKMENG